MAWIFLLFQLSSFVHGLAISSATDQRPRAAFVSLAHEHDLPAVLSSISQLEETFNHRYHYHWVFFSMQPLSEEFRRQTSNATGAICIYEVIAEDSLASPPNKFRQPLVSNTPPLDHNGGEGVSEIGLSPPFLGRISRWNSGPFASEKRLRDYDWFWRIEPGAQFTHDITFDVFRFMRDHEIAYGFNEALLDKDEIRTHSQPVRSFIDKHPDLLHADADVSWLLGGSEAPAESTNWSTTMQWPESILSMIQGSLSCLGYHNADWRQDKNCSGDNDDTGSPAEAFASWLSNMYKTGLEGISPTFDIGSLSFFRSQNHQDLFDHLDAMGDFYSRPLRDMAVPTISASMFLPQKSVWNYRRRDARHTNRPSPPEYTQRPKVKGFELNLGFNLRGTNRMGPQRRDSIREQERNPGESMAERFALWDLMAQDLSRQDAIPGLQSGHTVIDERNFSLS
ncbi:glycosyltransferase family 15 [Trichoderma arundinaceum]|uniref:Glycosyltransferase family 15 n=1 Tax=Trichoderma arundinaceum TaxID=490622 RepID=A0A395NZ11_TRIAR|nr:glycosyltransferase family 15 [Trichoderma arundinaceum]